MISHLVFFSGVAVGKEGNIFFIDGTRVRFIGSDGKIANYIGTNGPPKFNLNKGTSVTIAAL